MKKILALLLFLCFAFTGCNQTTDSKSKNITTTTDSSIVETTVTQKTTPTTPSDDDIIKDLFNKKQSDVQVRGSGVVTKILSDDNDGARHQRFILKLNSGQTLLIAHNIDIAPRLEGLAVGETVEFYGEYYYNGEGGGVHWTHYAPDGSHISGYLKWNGNIYQSTTTAQGTVVGNRNYIGNKNSHVLHVPTCNSLPYEQNRIYFDTIKEALNQGYHKHYECMGN